MHGVEFGKVPTFQSSSPRGIMANMALSETVWSIHGGLAARQGDSPTPWDPESLLGHHGQLSPGMACLQPLQRSC